VVNYLRSIQTNRNLRIPIAPFVSNKTREYVANFTIRRDNAPPWHHGNLRGKHEHAPSELFNPMPTLGRDLVISPCGRAVGLAMDNTT
jgi:hypothetical protein